MNLIKCYYKHNGVLRRIDAVKTMLKQERVPYEVRRRVMAVVK